MFSALQYFALKMLWKMTKVQVWSMFPHSAIEIISKGTAPTLDHMFTQQIFGLALQM